MYLSIFQSGELGAAEGLSIDPASLYCAFEQVTDPRVAQRDCKYESLFVLTVLAAIRRVLIGARDLIIDSAALLAWCRADPDAAIGHAPADHPRPQFAWVSRSHTVVSGLRLPRVLPALPGYCPRCPFRSTALAVAVYLYRIRPRVIRLDAGYSCLRPIAWIHSALGTVAIIGLPSQTTQEPFLLATDLGGIRVLKRLSCFL